MGFINVVRNISPRCDCAPWAGRSAVTDIGILASKDAVSIALLILLWKKIPSKPVRYSSNEEIGLGERSYKLIRI